MNEEDFLSSWLREDVEGEVEEMERLNKEAKEEESVSGKREVGETGKGLRLAVKNLYDSV